MNQSEWSPRILAFFMVFALLGNDVIASVVALRHMPTLNQSIPNNTVSAELTSPFTLDAIPVNDNVASEGAQTASSLSPRNEMEIAKHYARTMDFEVLDSASSLRGYVTIDPTLVDAPSHIVNVTRNATFYRLDGQYQEPTSIAIGVDVSRLGSVSDLSLVKVFFLDRESNSWKVAEGLGIDQEVFRVKALVPAETDYFAGMISSPEMPEAAAYVPTSVSDIEPASPATGMRLIQPPSANRQGSATLSYPLWIPQGRNGMTPPLSVSYNSDGGTGWMGLGWNVPKSMISVDTKWGVPAYSPADETEPYVWDGEALFMEGNRRANRPTLNSSGEVVPLERNSAQSTVRFFPRVMNSYLEIERRGTSPSNYRWVVTDGAQNKRYYGTIDGSKVDTNSVLLTSDGNIAQWYLTRTEDIWGNTVDYTYQKFTESSTGDMKQGGVNRVLKSITYTGYNGSTFQPGRYSVEFVTSDNRGDDVVSMKMGLKHVDDRRLDQVLVKYDGNTLVDYRFTYKRTSATLFKTVLTSIGEYRNNKLFYEHTFSYYEDPISYQSTPEELDTWNPSPWLNAGDDDGLFDPLIQGVAQILHPSALNTSMTSGYSVGGSLGAGFTPDLTPSKTGAFSAGINWSQHWTNTVRQMRDVNGDGIADVVYEDYDGDFSYYPVYRRNGSLLLGGRRDFEVGGINRNTSQDISFSLDYLSEGGFFAGVNYSLKTSRETRGLVDYNADGIPDILIEEDRASSPKVRFGVLQANGNITFTESSENTLNPVIKGVDFSFDDSEQLKEFQIVKTWIAPVDGTVQLGGTAQMVSGVDGECQVAIQRNSQFIFGGFNTVNATSTYTPPTQSVTVRAGDIIMFRVASGQDGQEDFLEWNPSVTYVGSSPDDGNQSQWYSSTANDGFVLSGGDGVEVLGSDDIKLDLNLSVSGQLSDDVFVVVEPFKNGVPQTPLSDKIGSSYSNISGLGILGQFSSLDQLSNYTANDSITLRISLRSTSNVDWNNISFRPSITYGDECAIGNVQYPLVDVRTFNKVLRMEGTESISVNPSLNYEIIPRIEVANPLDINSCFPGATQDQTGYVFMTVKSNGNFLSRLAIKIFYDHSAPSLNTLTIHPVNSNTGAVMSGTILDAEIINNNPNVFFRGSDVVNSEVSVEFHGDGLASKPLVTFLESTPFQLQVLDSEEQAQTIEEPQKNLYYRSFDELRTQHLGWGRFGWSPVSQSTVFSAIDTSELHELILQTVNMGGQLPNDSTSMANNRSTYSLENRKFIPLIPVRGETSRGLRTYQKSITSEESLDRYSVFGMHMGDYKYQAAMAPGYLGEYEITTDQTLPEEPGINPSYTARGALGYSRSNSIGFNTGFRSLSVSSVVSDKDVLYSRAKRVFRDINGDGYPDILNENDDQITLYPTNYYGSHTDGVQSINLSEDILNKSTANGIVTSLNLQATVSSNLEVNQSFFMNNILLFNGVLEQSKIPIGGSVGLNWSTTRMQFLDINGDGLQDEFYDDIAENQSIAPRFRLNEGNEFESLSFEAHGRDTRRTYSLNASLSTPTTYQTLMQGILGVLHIPGPTSRKAKSWELGLSTNYSINHSKRTYVDVTGDGLIDYLEYSTDWTNDKVDIYINEGGSFTFYQQITTDPVDEQMSQNTGLGFSLKGTGTGAFNLFGAKIKASLSASGDFSINGLENSFIDMNADGVPDYVEDSKGGSINVYYATFARNGMLKEVTNPLGGTFEISYDSEGQKSGYYEPQVKTHLSDQTNERMIWDMPQGKLVMSAVTINDGLNVDVAGTDLDGADSFTTRFAYDGGIHSRREREFLGFTRVATISPSHYHDGTAILEDECDYDGIEEERNVSHLFTAPYSAPDPTEVKVLGRYNMSVMEFTRPTAMGQDEFFAYSYLSRLPEKSYQLHVHEWRDSAKVYLQTPPDNVTHIGYEKWTHQHIELISESNPDYEIRLVDTKSGSETFGQVERIEENWNVITNLNSLGELSTIFPAVMEVKKVSFPVVEDRAHYIPSKTSFEYDEYFNVVRVEDAGTGVATTPVEEVVGTMQYTHYVYTEQENPCPIGTVDTVYNDGIMYGFAVRYTGSDPNYEDAVVYDYFPYSDCFPTNLPNTSLCQEGTNSFVSVHRKEVTETIDIIEVNYQANYSGNLIALLEYYPVDMDNSYQTGLLKKHQIYQTNTTAANLKRHSEVAALQDNKAPSVMRQYLNAGTYSESFVHYDEQFGLVDSVVGPPNHNGERAYTGVTYDPNGLGLVVRTRNHFGEKTTSIYNYGLQQILQTTDVNGHPMVYRYDPNARLSSVWAPREVYNSSNGPTVSFEYHPFGKNPNSTDPNETVPVAYTHHNTSNKGETITFTNAGTLNDFRATLFTAGGNTMTSSIYTATFTDRQGQAVQLHTQSDFTDPAPGSTPTTRLRVSGISEVNIFGLAITSRNDLILNTSTKGVFKPINTDVVGTTVYDYLSRPVEQASAYSSRNSSGTSTYSTVTTTSTYEWLGGLSYNPGFMFTTLVESAGTKSRTYTDSRGRQVAVRNGNDILTEFNYDPLGQVLKVKDPVQLETQYTYDNFGRVTQEIHPDRGTTNTTYDPASNVRTVDWAGDLISYEYSYNRLVNKLMPAGASKNLYDVEYIYGSSDGSDGANTVGRLLQIRQGITTNPFLVENYTYDELGNIHNESKTIAIPDVGTKTYQTRFYYDSFGRALSIKYPDNEVVRYHYSNLGALESVTSKMPNDPISNVISNISYDGYGNIHRIEYGNGTSNEFTYHDVTRGLLSNETFAKPSTSASVASVNSRDYFYNNRGMIDRVDFSLSSSIGSTSGGSVPGGSYSFNYTYDNVNRLKKTELFQGSSTSAMYQLDMTYSHAGEIMSKIANSSGSSTSIDQQASSYNFSYTYDSGNSHKLNFVSNGSALDGWDRSYHYNNQGSIEEIKLLDTKTSTYESDRIFVWNNEQQLVAVSMDNHNNIQHYVYDHTGTRMMKSAFTQATLSINDNDVGNTSFMDPYQVYVNAYYVESDFVDGLQATKHYYMGTQRIASDVSLTEVLEGPGGTGGEGPEPTPGEERIAENNSTTLNNPVVEQLKVILSDQGIEEGADYSEEELFMNNTMAELYPDYTSGSSYKAGSTGGEFTCCFEGDRYWYHPDYLGSVAMVTNKAGVVHQYFLTNPWGEQMYTYNAQSQGFDSPYRFNGKELDQETGYAYYGARYYDNQLSMWLSVDPLAMKGNNILRSPYVFTNNNPIMMVDPDGMSAVGASGPTSNSSCGSCSSGFWIEYELLHDKANVHQVTTTYMSSVRGLVDGDDRIEIQTVATVRSVIGNNGVVRSRTQYKERTIRHKSFLWFGYTVKGEWHETTELSDSRIQTSLESIQTIMEERVSGLINLDPEWNPWNSSITIEGLEEAGLISSAGAELIKSPLVRFATRPIFGASLGAYLGDAFRLNADHSGRDIGYWLSNDGILHNMGDEVWGNYENSWRNDGVWVYPW